MSTVAIIWYGRRLVHIWKKKASPSAPVAASNCTFTGILMYFTSIDYILSSAHQQNAVASPCLPLSTTSTTTTIRMPHLTRPFISLVQAISLIWNLLQINVPAHSAIINTTQLHGAKETIGLN